MEKFHMIKKYPNRRLYDMETSRYITLDDVKDLVLKHAKIKIVDASTNEDVTNYVLLQIINENEGGHSPIFTTEILQNIICFYGNPLQKMMSQFLEKSFSSFTKQHTDFEKYFEDIETKESPFNMMADLAKQNMAMWQSAQDHFFNKNNIQTKETNKTKTKNPNKSRSKQKKQQ